MEPAETCRDCGHDDRTPRRPSTVRRLLGLAPRPAECQEGVVGPSGWPEPCMCTAAFHGS